MSVEDRIAGGLDLPIRSSRSAGSSGDGAEGDRVNTDGMSTGGSYSSETTARDALLDALASTDVGRFYSGLAALVDMPDLHGVRGVHLVLDVAHRWRTSDVPNRVQAERMTAILGRVHLDAHGENALAAGAHNLPPGLRNTVADALPPHLRRLPPASGRGRPSERNDSISPRGDGSAAPSSAPATDPQSDTAPPVQASSDSFTPNGPARCATVVLLTSVGNHDSNRTLLEGSQFGVVVMDSVAKLETDLASNTDVCGCVIDQSILHGLGADAQRRLLRLLGRYSSFLWLRVDERGLCLPATVVRHEIKVARCLRASVPSESLSLQPDGRLRDAELDDIRLARDLLQTHDGAQYVPGELTVEQCRLLCAATRDHAQGVGDGAPLQVVCLETQFLAAGRSSARTVKIRVNRQGPSIVAKVDGKDLVADEIRRFQQYIRPWDDQLQPRAYFHGNAAAILFGLVPDGANSEKPAPMLETRLQELWNEQLLAPEPDAVRHALEERAALLGHGLDQTARRLGALNRNRPKVYDEFPSYANPDVRYFERLEAHGITWHLGPEAREARKRVAATYETLATAATVHGDVHLRNVLLRGDTEPHLIDYAGSGPGHPAIDLARLELALYLVGARHTDPEANCIDLQQRLSIGCATAEELAAEFPDFHRCYVNVACVRGMVAARDEALAVLGTYGVGKEHYLAAKFLVAWQALAITGLPTTLARVVITALAPTLI